MSKLIKINNIYYLPSNCVKVFPTAYRGVKYDGQSNTNIHIDIESKLSTENRLRHLSPEFAKDSYVISRTTDMICCSIAGYYFEINASTADLTLDGVRTKLCIKIGDTQLTTDTNTSRLLSWHTTPSADLGSNIADTWLDLDYTDPETGLSDYYFTGLRFVKPGDDIADVGVHTLNLNVETKSKLAVSYTVIDSRISNENRTAGKEEHIAGSTYDGAGTNAIRLNSQDNVADGDYSTAEGLGTIANGTIQKVFGKYNIADTTIGNDGLAEIVGGGESNSDNDRKNIRTLSWAGNEWLNGSITAEDNIISHKKLISQDLDTAQSYYSTDSDAPNYWNAKVEFKDTNNSTFATVGAGIGAKFNALELGVTSKHSLNQLGIYKNVRISGYSSVDGTPDWYFSPGSHNDITLGEPRWRWKNAYITNNVIIGSKDGDANNDSRIIFQNGGENVAQIVSWGNTTSADGSLIALACGHHFRNKDGNNGVALMPVIGDQTNTAGDSFIAPEIDKQYNLGTADKKFNTLYLSDTATIIHNTNNGSGVKIKNTEYTRGQTLTASDYSLGAYYFNERDDNALGGIYTNVFNNKHVLTTLFAKQATTSGGSTYNSASITLKAYLNSTKGNVEVKGHLVPETYSSSDTAKQYDLGSSSLHWTNAYIDKTHGDLDGLAARATNDNTNTAITKLYYSTSNSTPIPSSSTDTTNKKENIGIYFNATDRSLEITIS